MSRSLAGVASQELSDRIKTLGATLGSIEQVLDLDAMRAEIADLHGIVNTAT